jgi:hypothetical protein|tara:strand:+ start:575 stop:934 length:360 start_codon:yes stop_codon:yes gene_type:complete
MSAIRLGDENLEKAVMHIEKLGSRLAEKESQYEKHTLEMKLHRDEAYISLSDKKMTQKEKEAWANTQLEVISHISILVELKKEIIDLKYKLKSAELFCDLFRTQSANLRREKKFYQELE